MTSRARVLLAAVSLLWGVPYLLIAVAVDETSPAVVVAVRTAVAALVLLPLAAASGALVPLRGRAVELLGLSAVQIAVPFALIPAGERWVSSSLTAILIAAEPLLVVVLGAGLGVGERITGTRLAGLALGLAGVATPVMVAGMGMIAAGTWLTARASHPAPSEGPRRPLPERRQTSEG